MNSFCSRIYQGVMKIGMYCLPWKMPKTIEGEGASNQIPTFLEEIKAKKPLIVTDENLVQLHLLDGLMDVLNKKHIPYVIFDKVIPNPTDTNVIDGIKQYKSSGCDCIIAFGGGSPMDCAKAMAALLAKPSKTVAQIHGLFKVLKHVPNVIYVPTTSGTGSEMTMASVVTDVKTHHKAAINDIVLMPRYTILDPRLTVSMTPELTATTGMDALCHAVEAYTNHTYNTKIEDDMAKNAVRLIYENLHQAYLDGTDITARENMQKAAFCAGRAFTRGSVGYVHAIGHALGGMYDCPHGQSMSILLPHVMRRYGSAAHSRLSELCDVCGLRGADNSQAAKAEAFLTWMEELKVKLNIPTYLPILEEKDIDKLATCAYKEGNPLYPTPVTWSKQDFTDFLNMMKARKS